MSWKSQVNDTKKTWLVTGAAGFIGSNIVETLLLANQKVIGIDNFSTGFKHNLEDVQKVVQDKWNNFTFIEADICNMDTCMQIMDKIDIVLHQAAVPSVPRSIQDPLSSHHTNVNGFINLLYAAKENNVKRFVYASSSSVYGDEQTLPKVEEKIGRALSPYAVTKRIDELYADVFSQHYTLEVIGLRYFNVFGKRQDPNGAYAAVIPKWIAALFQGQPCIINGDGQTSRDFCFVENAVQMNILAGITTNKQALNQVYNVAYGQKTTLLELFTLLQNQISNLGIPMKQNKPIHEDFRPGDIRHSLADISKAQQLLGYAPNHSVQSGLQITVPWYIDKLQNSKHL